MDTPDRPRVAVFLRELRKQHSLTQGQLAQSLGISRQAIIALEQGQNAPSLAVVFRIAHHFQLSLDEMFQFNHPPRVEGGHMPEEMIPFSPLREMREAIDRLMDEGMTVGYTSSHQAAPALNVHQTNHALVVEANLPGYKHEDIDVEVGDNFMTITGKRIETEEEKNKQYLHREWQNQTFSRTLTLPDNIKAGEAHADMKDGILTITIPKAEPEKPRITKLKVTKQ